MCGLSTVSFTDLKENARVDGSDATFRNVVSWFWKTVSGFTQEEMAKMLQFVTGCSQLPPGGFKDLHPSFTITHTPTHGRLPTAHTWLDTCIYTVTVTHDSVLHKYKNDFVKIKRM